MRLGLLLLIVILTLPLYAANPATEAAMRAQLGDGFLIRKAGIFLCAGNLPQAQFDAIVDGTVTGCARALWKQYFTKRPGYIIRVYLFKDAASYQQYAKVLFGDTDISHFGYYKPDEKALVMNIGTGTGTLVHEMVHALMAPDFSNAPTWFSEGLASLYEQCRIGGDRLVGLVNWRLPVLQDGLRRQTTLPLSALIATKPEQFLDAQLGVHYAQARYLCMYLQERGVLEAFYRSYRDHVKDDPTGANTLARLTKKSVATLEKDWLVWLRTLQDKDTA